MSLDSLNAAVIFKCFFCLFFFLRKKTRRKENNQEATEGFKDDLRFRCCWSISASPLFQVGHYRIPFGSTAGLHGAAAHFSQMRALSRSPTVHPTSELWFSMAGLQKAIHYILMLSGQIGWGYLELGHRQKLTLKWIKTVGYFPYSCSILETPGKHC